MDADESFPEAEIGTLLERMSLAANFPWWVFGAPETDSLVPLRAGSFPLVGGSPRVDILERNVDFVEKQMTAQVHT